jgi:CPA2 family monovalent cation:H+ antiporter-2
MSTAPEAIRAIRELKPGVQILARSASIRERDVLRRAGADLVFSGEAEVALAFTEAVLRTLGATPEQIERERARVHAELSQDSDTSASL